MYTPFENRTTAAPAPAALGGKCRGLSVDELKRLPAWTAMAQYIRTTWGGGSYNLWTAWDGATEAWMCVGDDVVDLQATGSPGCTINTVSTGGILVGTNGSVTIVRRHCFFATVCHLISVTESSTIGISYTATLTVGVPDLISAFTNQDQYSFKTEINNQVQQSVTLMPRVERTCSLTYESKTCHETVRAEFRTPDLAGSVSGFNERTQGHYYWHVLIDNQPYNTRTSYSEFTG
ncbi:hypothetical protein BDZ89DRAFT_1075049, partial [Hymenopellis radicata]